MVCFSISAHINSLILVSKQFYGIRPMWSKTLTEFISKKEKEKKIV
jgi:hypothetical protein